MPIQSEDRHVDSGNAYDFLSEYSVYTVKSGVVVDSSDAGVNAAGVYSNDHQNVAVQNYGTITSANFAVYFETTGDRLDNATGAYVNGFYGVVMTGEQEIVNNKGTISGSAYGIADGPTCTIINSGDISGSTGIQSTGGYDSIINSGSIYGVGFEATSTGILMTVTMGQSTIKNTGTIGGNAGSVMSSGTGALSLSNKGTLDGNVVLANTGGDTVRNTGEIDGYVKLGNGTNTFNGRGGSVDGYVQGGTRVDTIYAGNDGETIAAGAGHDAIYGGAGSDTFAFSSINAADSDTIFGFKVGDDTLRLSHAAFTKLTAGATPVFSVANAPTSATDHLFYNATSGGLFYDADGSGSGAATMFAKLDPNLALTARDFKVV